MSSPLRTILICFAVSLGPFTQGPGMAAAESVVQDKTAEFKGKFDQAMQVNSKRQMEKLMRDYPQETVELIIATAEGISRKANEELYKRMNALRGTWKSVHNSPFCEKMEEYFSLLDGPRKRERNKLKVDYQKSVRRFFDETSKGGKNEGLGLLGTEFKALAEQFGKVADMYHCSQSWFFAAACTDEGLRGDDGNLEKAEEYYRAGLAAREDVGLKDRTYKENAARQLTLQGLGFGPQPVRPDAPVATEGKAGEKGKEGGAEPVATVPAAPVVATMAFEAVPKIDTYVRPNFFLDAHYPIWGAIGLKAVDSTSPVGRLQDTGLLAIRHSAAKVGLDEDGDGKPDTDVPLRGKPILVETKVGSGEDLRQNAFMAVIGIDTDTYQSIQVNLQPTDQFLNIYTVPAGSMVGDVAGTPVRVIDEDMNGVYGGIPQKWAHVGLTEGNYQPEIDSVVIGSSKRALPWSEHMQIDGVWYKMESQTAGTKLKASPLPNLATGFLKLSVKGLKPDFLIVQGQGKMATSFFDVSANKGKAVEVPAGVYKLYSGMVSKGKKRQLMKALIVPGSGESYKVAAGETAEVKIGSPYGFDFKTDVDDGKVKVIGKSVAVTGVGGERYERLYGCVPRPDVSYRKPGAKKGSKGEDMPIMLSQDDLYSSTFGFSAAWFPYDLELDLKGGVTDPEVQLTEKKNKLFGKIESAWKN